MLGGGPEFGYPSSGLQSQQTRRAREAAAGCHMRMRAVVPSDLGMTTLLTVVQYRSVVGVPLKLCSVSNRCTNLTSRLAIRFFGLLLKKP